MIRESIGASDAMSRGRGRQEQGRTESPVGRVDRYGQVTLAGVLASAIDADVFVVALPAGNERDPTGFWRVRK
jgi:hypothetical protein